MYKRQDLEALLRSEPEARLATGWRAGLVGEPIRRLVAGEAALAFAGEGRLVLEERSRRPLPGDLSDDLRDDLARGAAGSA